MESIFGLSLPDSVCEFGLCIALCIVGSHGFPNGGPYKSCANLYHNPKSHSPADFCMRLLQCVTRHLGRNLPDPLSEFGPCIVLFIVGSHGFPSGGPYKSCANLYPKHSGTNAQATAAPYSVTVNSTQYAEGEIIEGKAPSHACLLLSCWVFKLFSLLGQAQPCRFLYQTTHENLNFWAP